MARQKIVLYPLFLDTTLKERIQYFIDIPITLLWLIFREHDIQAALRLNSSDLSIG